MLWSPGLPLIGTVQSLHLGRIVLAFLSKLLPYDGREGIFLDTILCAEQMRRHSTREPCRHQAVPVLFVKTLASKRQGGRVGLKRNRSGNQMAFSREGHQPSEACFHSRSGLGGKSH